MKTFLKNEWKFEGIVTSWKPQKKKFVLICKGELSRVDDTYSCKIKNLYVHVLKKDWPKVILPHFSATGFVSTNKYIVDFYPIEN